MALCSLCFFFHVTDNFFSFLKNDVALKWPATSSLISTNTSNIGQKKKKNLKQQVTFPSQRHRCLKGCNFFILIHEIIKKEKKIKLTSGLVKVVKLSGKPKESFVFRVPFKCTIYMWKKKTKKQTNQQPVYKKWQIASVHQEKYTIYKRKHQQNILQTTVWFFGRQKKKTLLLTTYLKT